jgi:hypothetical protein
MPKYRVLEKSFINNALVEEGAIVTYDEKPGPNLEPMDAAAETARAEADSALVKGVSAEDIARQRMAAAGGSPRRGGSREGCKRRGCGCRRRRARRGTRPHGRAQRGRPGVKGSASATASGP